MSVSDIFYLYRRELRAALREKGILLNILVVPVLLYPGLLWLIFMAIAFVQGQQERFVSRIALEGLPPSHAAARQHFEAGEGVRLVDHFEGQVGVPEMDIRAGELDLWVRFAAHPGVAGNLEAQIFWDSSKERSATARARFEALLETYREPWLQARVLDLGVAEESWRSFEVETHNAASASDVGAFILGLIAPIFMVVVIAVGCIYPAVDCTAGERERGTWETLMTVAASRTSILVAKYLYVASMGALAGLLNIVALTLTLPAILSPWIGREDAQFGLDAPWVTIPLVLVAALLLALSLAAGMMLLAVFARSFKEGQSLIGPFFLLAILPPLLVMSPDLELDVGWALVPVANVALLFRQAIGGDYNWPLVSLVLAVQAISVILLLGLARIVLGVEEVFVGTYPGHLGHLLRARLRPNRLRPNRLRPGLRRSASSGGGSPHDREAESPGHDDTEKEE